MEAKPGTQINMREKEANDTYSVHKHLVLMSDRNNKNFKMPISNSLKLEQVKKTWKPKHRMQINMQEKTTKSCMHVHMYLILKIASVSQYTS